MDEDDVPPWLPKTAQEIEALLRRYQPLIQAA
jgi:hypothetical protein